MTPFPSCLMLQALQLVPRRDIYTCMLMFRFVPLRRSDIMGMGSDEDQNNSLKFLDDELHLDSLVRSLLSVFHLGVKFSWYVSFGCCALRRQLSPSFHHMSLRLRGPGNLIDRGNARQCFALADISRHTSPHSSDG